MVIPMPEALSFAESRRQKLTDPFTFTTQIKKRETDFRHAMVQKVHKRYSSPRSHPPDA
jgi:hypothetical protein